MRTRVILGTVILTTLLCACGNDAKVIEGTVQSKATETGGETAAEMEPDAGAEDTSASVEEQQGPAAANYKGYVFIYQDVAIEMDADAAPIIEQLGEPDSYFEAPSCAFEGIDKMYTYRSFELDTYPTENKDYISSVIFKDDTLTTVEGIGIGDSVSSLEAAYGTQWNDEDGMMVYEKDGMKLCFIVDGDSVISVEFRSCAAEG